MTALRAQSYDVVVVGAGASGLMCAAKSAERGKKVLLIEKSSKPGRKILMSGGGRCNFTNLDVSDKNFISHNPHFCKSALKRYTNWDFIGKVLEYGIDYHERDLGKLFCDDSAKDILNLLLSECSNAGVECALNTEIDTVYFDKLYYLKTTNGDVICESLVVATGGLSIPSMGSSSFAYHIAEQFGLKVLPRRAGLVPFTFSDDIKSLCEALSGLSLVCEVRILEGKKSKKHTPTFCEPVLFTHRGLSGPAILQLSNYWQAGEAIEIDLLPSDNVKDILLAAKHSANKQRVKNILSVHLAKNLVVELEKRYWPEISDKPCNELSAVVIENIASAIHHWEIKPSGTEGYRTAEVTLGGVDTEELSSKTLEANKQPGLFFIGEAVDVTGWLGGFNFQWAWSSAVAVSEFV